MLSIAAAGAGHGEYYLGLTHSDYYLEAGEPPGAWRGQGAKRLGLRNTVTRGAFQALLGGRLPDGKPAVQEQNGHKAGYDLTFNVPKSVSAVWAVSGRELREKIERLVDESVDAALGYIEETAAFSRRGHGGVRHDPADLIFATFQHGSSRNLDPHLHVHAFLMNVCIREDGTTGTLYGPAVFRAKMAAGALFRAELSARLERELGFAIVRDGSSFAVEGVPSELVSQWSSRRHEIEEALARHGHTSAKASEIAALDTRGKKHILSRSVLHARWEDVAHLHGFSENSAEKLRTRARLVRDGMCELTDAVNRALGRITVSQSHFSERELVRFTAEEAQGQGVDAAEVRMGVMAHLHQSREIVRLGFHLGELRFTTKEILELERLLLARVRESREANSHHLPSEATHAVLGLRPTMTAEQTQAFRHATQAQGAIRVITGMAGTGKTYLLSAV